jgi:hypothetical protein
MPPAPTSQAINSYNLPSVSALVHLHHASAGNPVPSTWFAAIKAGNCEIFPSLTLRNAKKHCPSSNATIKGRLKQTQQILCSTKPKPYPSLNFFAILAEPNTPPTEEPSANPSIKPTEFPPTNKLYITDVALAKHYTNNTGRLPIWARSGNQYITIAYHTHCNVVLCAPYPNRSHKHPLAGYNSIMHCLTNHGHNLDLQILDNKVSIEFKAAIEDTWKARYPLVPLNVHHCNQTLKSHFLAIIAGLPPTFPQYNWDLLLPQTELTLNLLCQSSITPSMSAWAHFNAHVNYNARVP